MDNDNHSGGESSALQRFLGKMEGTKIPYVEITEDAKNPYCDSCSGAIHPNKRVQMYAVDRLLTGDKVGGPFRTLRLHCEDCFLPRLIFDALGYNELLLEATLSPEWRIYDIDVVDASGTDSGLGYNPEEILEKLFQAPYHEIVVAGGGEAQGPLDAVDILSKVGIDPRRVIHEDGTIRVSPADREKFEQEAHRLMKKQARGDSPPQPPLSAKIKAWNDLEDPWEGL